VKEGRQRYKQVDEIMDIEDMVKFGQMHRYAQHALRPLRSRPQPLSFHQNMPVLFIKRITIGGRYCAFTISVSSGRYRKEIDEYRSL
jgi:hypothetical protein